MGILFACDGSTSLSLALTSLPASWSSQRHSHKAEKHGSLSEHGHSTTVSLALTSLPASWSSQHHNQKEGKLALGNLSCSGHSKIPSCWLTSLPASWSSRHGSHKAGRLGSQACGLHSTTASYHPTSLFASLKDLPGSRKTWVQQRGQLGIPCCCEHSTIPSWNLTSLPANWSSQHHSHKAEKHGILFEHEHSTTPSLAVTNLPANWRSQRCSRRASLLAHQGSHGSCGHSTSASLNHSNLSPNSNSLLRSRKHR